MKSKLLLLIPFIFSIILTKANEKEPNNDFQTANTLALNGKDSGKIKTTSDEDWWDVTINADGELDVTVTVRNHQLINVYIIEECNGGFCNHVIAWGYTDTSITLYAGNAGAGTYTIRLFGNGGTTPSYYLSNTAIPVTGANDEEINDDIYTAIPISLDATSYGHLDYYYPNEDATDWTDYYSIKTKTDGMLSFSVNASTDKQIQAALGNIDGTHILDLVAVANDGKFNFNIDGLSAGTYFVALDPFSDGNVFTYSITPSLKKYRYKNDKEPNNKPFLGSLIANNDTAYGRVGFLKNNNTRDSADWWKINYTGNGNMILNILQEKRKDPANREFMNIEAYTDTNSAPILKRKSKAASTLLTLNNLANGIIYVKISPYYNGEWHSYAIVPSFNLGASSNLSPVNNLQNKNLGIKVFPSPSSDGSFTVDLGSIKRNVTIVVTDINGKKLLIMKKSLVQEFNIKVDEVPGMYYLQLNYDDRKANVPLIVK